MTNRHNIIDCRYNKQNVLEAIKNGHLTFSEIFRAIKGRGHNGRVNLKTTLQILRESGDIRFEQKKWLINE